MPGCGTGLGQRDQGQRAREREREQRTLCLCVLSITYGGGRAWWWQWWRWLEMRRRPTQPLGHAHAGGTIPNRSTQRLTRAPAAPRDRSKSECLHPPSQSQTDRETEMCTERQKHPPSQTDRDTERAKCTEREREKHYTATQREMHGPTCECLRRPTDAKSLVLQREREGVRHTQRDVHTHAHTHIFTHTHTHSHIHTGAW
jgi:hypothetical protein